MLHVADVGEPEMVALFLKTEIASPRWGAVIARHLACDGGSRQIVDNPDTTDAYENAYRAHLLGEFRGYRRNKDLFEGFPEHVTWARVRLTRDELWRVRYIDYDYWVELSNGSRLAVDAARAIRAGKVVFRVPNDGFLALADALQHGAVFPELILVRAGENARLVVLEGHARLTAYALVPDTVPATLPVLLGTAPEITHWGLY